MKAKMKPLGLLVGLIVAAGLYFIMDLIRNGIFSSPVITEKDIGPYTLVYTKYIGEYKNVGPVMDKVYYDLKNRYGIATTKGFGIYYDDPKTVSRDKLRSIVGCIVESKSINEIGDLRSSFGVYEYPKSKSVVAEFPYKGKMSVIIGIFKTYPKLSAYVDSKKYESVPIMELYDQPNKKIEYISSYTIDVRTFLEMLDTAK
jgi:GyrI-like small molecule binding domain